MGSGVKPFSFNTVLHFIEKCNLKQLTLKFRATYELFGMSSSQIDRKAEDTYSMEAYFWEKQMSGSMCQNKAARVALTCGRRLNIRKMHASLCWLDVKHRFLYLLMVFLRNIITTKMPYILYRKLSFSSDVHNYATRHAARGYFILPRALSQCTVLYRAMKEWNDLPNYVTQQRNMVSF